MMCSFSPSLSSFDVVVVKVGSGLLVQNDRVRADWLYGVCQDIQRLHQAGTRVVVVSSGAVALGRVLMGLPRRALKLDEKQAAAAVGQISLSQSWAHSLSQVGLPAGQVLLTLLDTENRRSYLNARRTLQTLMDHYVIPVINENDTIATSEIRYGDNDRLAARVATMVDADALIILSDVDGLYTANPQTDPDAVHVPIVQKMSADIDAMAGGAASLLSNGGMVTKLDAARLVMQSGVAMCISSGVIDHPLQHIDDPQTKKTWFVPDLAQKNARKRYIVAAIDVSGSVTIDHGAERALRANHSLLAAGVIKVEGSFQRGDVIEILTLDGGVIGRGLVAYDDKDADKIRGLKSEDIEAVLGYPPRAALIHKNDLVVL